MSFKTLLLIFSIAATITACDNKYHLEEKRDIANAQWMYRDTFDFNFTIQDTTALYNLYLDLGANKNFASQNIYLRLHTGFPDGRRIAMTKSFDVYDNQGKLQEKQHILIQENAFFNKTGNYKITVEQFMRQDSVPGITSVGMAIQQLDGKRK